MDYLNSYRRRGISNKIQSNFMRHIKKNPNVFVKHENFSNVTSKKDQENILWLPRWYFVWLSVFHNCPCQLLTVPVIVDAVLSVTFFDLSQYIYPSFSQGVKNEAPLFAVASSSIWSVRRDNEHPVTRHCVHSSEGNNKMAAAVLQSLSSSLFAYYFSCAALWTLLL